MRLLQARRQLRARVQEVERQVADLQASLEQLRRDVEALEIEQAFRGFLKQLR